MAVWVHNGYDPRGNHRPARPLSSPLRTNQSPRDYKGISIIKQRREWNQLHITQRHSAKIREKPRFIGVDQQEKLRTKRFRQGEKPFSSHQPIDEARQSPCKADAHEPANLNHLCFSHTCAGRHLLVTFTIGSLNQATKCSKSNGDNRFIGTGGQLQKHDLLR